MKPELLFSVFPEEPGAVECVFVFLAKLDLGKACGLLDDGFVKDGVIESGFVSGRVGVFFG